MSLFTGYQGWLDGVRDWLDVDDYTDAQIQSFLALGQIRLNRDLMSVYMETFVDVTVTDITAGKPINLKADVANFSKIRLVVPSWSESAADSLSYSEFVTKVGRDYNDRGGRSYFAIDSGELHLLPFTTEGDVIDVRFYTMVESLGSTVDENIFSENHSDALLYAASLEAAPYMVEDERIPIWQVQYQIIVEQINSTVSKVKLGSVPLVRQIDLYNRA